MNSIRHLRHLSATATLAALALANSDVLAQADLNRPAPNVMLAVDSSGSMEYTATPASDCSDPPCLPKCYPDESDSSNHESSRWIDLVEVLTGTISNYSCWAQDRSTTDFRDEFEIDGVAPYDGNGGYSLPYHRPQSALCTPGPGALPPSSSPHLFPTGYLDFHTYSSSGNALGLTSCTDWAQLRDGLLDTLNQQIRFGLMTFDTHPDPGTGENSGIADWPGGMAGTWSYFVDSAGTTCPVDGISISTAYCQGNPVGCTTGPFPMEVGARNNYAPPFEGRMVAFGPWDATGTELSERNGWIQDILLTTRPYGATPIAGMLADARQFFWEDESTDPLTGKDFGPKDDPLINPECRKNFLVVLSDGEPNLDMRPYCEGSTCPFFSPEDIADELSTGGVDPDQFVRTYAVGFAVSEVDPEGDGVMTPCEDLPETTYCSDPAYADDRALKACCTLNEIAFHGTPAAKRTDDTELTHALFADNPDELRSALSRIFNEALAAVTNRTQPVFSSATGAGSASKAFQFLSSVDVRSVDLWRGKLQRQRLVCDSSGDISEPPIDENAGDDFIANVNSGSGPARQFYTVLSDDVDGSARSIRPFLSLSALDGVGDEGGTLTDPAGASQFVSTLDADRVALDDTTCDTASENLTASQCKDRIFNWLVGLDNGTDYHRCRNPGSDDCSLVADILHSTPQVRGRPDEFLRDDSYTAFARQLEERDTVLYTSSNDGFFHAFFVAPGDADGDDLTTKENNELWAFMPPAVLTAVRSEYPATHQLLLDGKPVIKDVVATETSDGSDEYRLDRTRTQATAQGGTWRTIMVQSFGAQRGGYFALDVTKPTVDATDGTTGPKFLWQLTTDEAGKEIFGTGGTPLITTLFMDTGAANDPIREVAVAILPGGYGNSSTGSGCDGGPALDAVPSTFSAATTVGCYADSAAARSLTVVRLDSGEIIRTFRPPASEIAQPVTFDLSVLTEVDTIPAPIVGEPAVFPADTGSVADRIFVGDQEGRIWRIDVTDTDPEDWTMEVFFDAYAYQSVTPREPIVTPPILSVDNEGQITLNFSTGDQEVLTENTGLETYVFSVVETVDDGAIKAEVQWRHLFEDGDRVIGPMILFDRRLFFSVFSPGAAEDCQPGTSTVYATNYLIPKDGADEEAASASNTNRYITGGKGEFVTSAGTEQQTVETNIQDGVVFGVGIRQVPSCSVDVPDPSTDDFLGYGTTTTTTTSNPGKFQLVMQVGGSSQGAPGEIVTDVVDLASPSSPVQVSTWAPILE